VEFVSPGRQSTYPCVGVASYRGRPSSHWDYARRYAPVVEHATLLHITQAHATVRLCWIKEKCLKTDLKCVNRWSSWTVQWERVPVFRSSNRATTSSSVQIVWQNWQKLLCGWLQQTRLTVWADQISEVAWLLERSNQITIHNRLHTKKNFLCQGFQYLQHYKHTCRQIRPNALPRRIHGW